MMLLDSWTHLSLQPSDTASAEENVRRRMPRLCSPAGLLPWKVATDYVVAAALLVLTAPVMLVAALLVRLTSRGPAFYSQTRLGLLGQPYTIYKLRSMSHDCERQSGPQWSQAGDPRITPLGRLLRKTHLDELPQLWNVLRGDMSLVGPRPERPELVPALEQALPHYRGRLRVRPGVTGLAQVQLPADSDIDGVRRKLAYDLYYTRCVSPWLDVRILLATALKVVGGSFGMIQKLCGLPGAEIVQGEYRSHSSAALRPAQHLVG